MSEVNYEKQDIDEFLVEISLDKKESETITNLASMYLQKKHSLPGFRKGKSPVDLLISKHQDTFHNYIIEYMIELGIEWMKTHQHINLYEFQEAHNLNFDNERYTLFFSFYSEPYVEIPKKLKGLPIDQDNLNLIEVTEKEISNTILAYQERFSSSKKKTNNTYEATNSVSIDYEVWLDNNLVGDKKSTVTKIPLQIADDQKTTIWSTLVDYILKEQPELNKEYTINVNPDDLYGDAFKNQNLQVKEARLIFSILEIQELDLIPINDKFFSELSLKEGVKITNEVELNKYIKTIITRKKRAETLNKSLDALVTHLMPKSNLYIADKYLKKNTPKDNTIEVYKENKKKSLIFSNLLQKIIADSKEKYGNGLLDNIRKTLLLYVHEDTVEFVCENFKKSMSSHSHKEEHNHEEERATHDIMMTYFSHLIIEFYIKKGSFNFSN